MKTFSLIFLQFCSICTFGQQKDSFIYNDGSEAFTKRFMRLTSKGRLTSSIDTSCTGYYSALANEDIANGHPQLLVQHYQIGRSYADIEFQERYHVTTQIYGSILLDMQECLEAYNERIFRHLDSTCNKNWRLDASRSANSYLGYKRYVKKRLSKQQ